MKITKAILEKLILEVIKDFDEEDLPPMQTADDPDPSMGRPLPKSMIRRGDVEKDPDKYPAQRDRMIKRFRDRQKLMHWQEHYLPKIERDYDRNVGKGADDLLDEFWDMYGGAFVEAAMERIITAKKSSIVPEGVEIDEELKEKIFLNDFFEMFSRAKHRTFFSGGEVSKFDLLKNVYETMLAAGFDDPEAHLKKTREYPANPLAGTTTG